MSDKKQMYYAKNLSDVFYQLKAISGLKIVSGCTQHKIIPDVSLSVRSIKELNFSTKHEMHFDFGPEITLSEILEIDPSKLPSVFYEAVKSVANSNIRNIATLAGNICAEDYRHTLFAPLLGLDAKLEIKNETETDYIPMTKFDKIPKGWVLTKVIIPVDEWEVAIFKRLGPGHLITENSASFVFLANTLKNQISTISIAFAGPFCLRSKELENMMLGAYLPLNRNLITEFVAEAGRQYDIYKGEQEVPDILKAQFLNLVKYSLEQLT